MDKNLIKNQYGKPHFLGIGAPKTATTWLDYCLSQHSQIWTPPWKELSYFNRCEKSISEFMRSCCKKLPQFAKETIKGRRLEKPFYTFRDLWTQLPPQHPLFVLFHMLLYFPYLFYCLAMQKNRDKFRWYTKFFLGRLKMDPEKWYTSLFEPTGQQICGEFTPIYDTLSESSIAYMLSFNNDIRIIYLIRNPIERDWSHISMHTSNAWGSLSLCDFQKYRWVQQYNDYLCTLKRYLKYVAPENLFLGFYEDILFHQDRFLAAVQGFLGVSIEDISHKPRETGKYKEIKTEYAVYLAQRNIRKIEKMASVFGGYAQFWLDVASELCQSDTTIHSDETFLSTPFATNDLWRSRWEYSGAKDFQSGPLSRLSCVDRLIS